jgi:molecular chaperone GrpE
LLANFRAWLLRAAAAGTLPAAAQEGEAEAIDLHTLVGQFIAVGHEVNLQTKAVRAQQEQNAEALRQLGQALAALEKSQAAVEQARSQGQDESLRPLLKTLVDVNDALGLAAREVPRAQGKLRPLLDAVVAAAGSPPSAPAPPRAAPPPPPSTGWLARLLGGGPPAPPEPDWEPQASEADYLERRDRAAAHEEHRRQAHEVTDRVRQLFESFLTGYTMSLHRIERALRQHGLEPIPCVGKPFDPELMEVVEAVPDSGRPAGEVLEEVRRGYLWRGRVFRYAQVRVATQTDKGIGNKVIGDHEAGPDLP